jgi:hypothetical protein
MSWKEQKYGHGTRQGRKPRMTVLARQEENYCSTLCVPPVFYAVPLNEQIKQTCMLILGREEQESIYNLINSAVT